MALRGQPYIPLYVQDFMTDEKLNECSAESTGVYIRIMCVMHKSEKYGTILLRQKDKQDEQQVKNFACKLARQMPYQVDVIERALQELIEEGVLTVNGDLLSQKRMVKDGELSDKRALSGSMGGNQTKINSNANGFATAKVPAKPVAKQAATTEYESEGEIETVIDIKNVPKKGVVRGIEKQFNVFWNKYPRKIAKPKAYAAFEKLKPSAGLLDTIMDAIEAQKASEQWQKDNGQYIPHPATWLNQRRWEDEITMHDNGADDHINFVFQNAKS